MSGVFRDYRDAEEIDIAERYGGRKCSDCVYWLIGWQEEKELGQGNLVQGQCRKRAPIADFPILEAIGNLLGLIAHAAEEAANINHDPYAPYSFVTHDDRETFWPRTEEESWCAEFERGRKPISGETLARIEALHERWEAEEKAREASDESADSSASSCRL